MRFFGKKETDAEKAARYHTMAQARRHEERERENLRRAKEEYRQSAPSYAKRQEMKENLRKRYAPTREEKIEQMKADTEFYKVKAENARAHKAYEKATETRPPALKRGEKGVSFPGRYFAGSSDLSNLDTFGKVGMADFGKINTSSFGTVNPEPFGTKKKGGKKGNNSGGFDGWFM